MEARRLSVSLPSIENATYAHTYRIKKQGEWLKLVTEDAQKAERHALAECPCCYRPYGNAKMGGASVTFRQCAMCDQRLMSGNTNVAIVCIDCAKRAGICKECGGDIDLKQRRSPRDLEVKEQPCP
ncbi:hypothetical protein K2D_16420 [Planctomycetes bacterium K2D]|nr:hypothetical protein K2D_16420 [Planctomycetes bacterium K2D]